MEELNELVKNFHTKEIIFYSIFGILTLVINIASFYILNSFLYIPENNANLIAISVAVIFSYFANRILVFHSKADEFGEKVVEFCKFLLGRLFTMSFEYIGCYLLFEYVPISFIASKCITVAIVVVIFLFLYRFVTLKK